MSRPRERGRGPRPALLLVLALAATGRGAAVPTKTWIEAPEGLIRGQARSVAVTSRGGLVLAPEITRLGGEGPAGGAAHVWSAAVDSRENLFLGTGPEGRIVRVGKTGSASVFFTTSEPMVTALAFLPGGDLLAGTAPGGRIYRIRPDGAGEPWCETGERYVWSLAATEDGTVYAATGDQGLVLRVGRSGAAETYFDADEAHVTSLVWHPSGGLLAGGAGRGLVYRIEAKNRARVLHDDDLQEVSALLLEPDGTVIAALAAPPEPEPRPPAVRIQMPTGAAASPERVGEMDDRPVPMMQGIIEGLAPSPDARVGARQRGRLVRLGTDGSVTELWRSSTETPFCLSRDAGGRPVFGTGEPARLYRLAEDGEVDLVATLQEGQVSRLVRGADGLALATSNPAAVYRLETLLAAEGTFVSGVHDAQATARWGTLRFRAGAQGASGRVRVQARSGSTATPDATWSDWSSEMTEPDGSPIRVPPGRFLQWRATLPRSGAAPTRIEEIAVTYAPVNRPPVVEGLRIDGSATAVSGPATFRWSARDPDGDPVEVEVRYRSGRGDAWKTAVRGKPATDGSENAADWKEGRAEWDTAAVAEGEYEIRAIATDRSSNPPEEGREVAVEPALRLVVDRSPPEIEMRRLADGALEIVVRDAMSPIARLEILEGERVSFLGRAVDGVCDSKREIFRLERSEAGGGDAPRRARAVDSAGNAAEREFPAR